jgi:autotransporter-associated beta strand protein
MGHLTRPVFTPVRIPIAATHAKPVMKIPCSVTFTLPALAATFGLLSLSSPSAFATDFEKADNTTALNLAGSYTPNSGTPGTNDRILIDSVMTANRTATMGADLSIAGILIDATATKVFQINGSNTLTLGSSGISILAASGAGLTFNGPALLLGADQTWDFGSRGATFSGGTTVNENSRALVINMTNQIYFHNSTAMTLGAQITGTGGSLTLDDVTGSSLTVTNSTSTFTGGASISTGSTLTASTMRVGAGTSSAVGTGQITLKGGAFQYSGSTATVSQNVVLDSRFVSTFEVTTAGQTLTLSSFKNSNTSNTGSTANGANLGGTGNLTVTNVIADSTQALKTAFTITKFGTGTLTLNAVNTYTGATTINAGTLALGSSGSISNSSAITVAAGATFDTSAKSTYAFNTANATTVGIGATSAGLINSAAVTFSSASLVLDFGSTSTLLASYTILTKTGFTGDFASVTATGTSISGSFVNAGSGNWTLNSGGYNLTFSESLGTITAVSSVPEPSSYAAIFGSLALGGATLRRRRVKQGA